jgi:hypothetical protein
MGLMRNRSLPLSEAMTRLPRLLVVLVTTALVACLPTPTTVGGAPAALSPSPASLELAALLGGTAEAELTVGVGSGGAVRAAAPPFAPWLTVAPASVDVAQQGEAEFVVRATCADVAALYAGWVVLEADDEHAVLPVRLTCRGAGPAAGAGADAEPAGEAARDELLRWQPPRLEAPRLVRVGTEPDAVTLEPGVDYVIELPDRPLTRGLNVSGGRNVVIIGGEIAIPWQGPAPSIASRRALHITHATGVVHVEGLLLHGDDISEGIQINAPEAIVQIQNVGVYGIHARDQVGFSDNHPDLIQSYGNAREIRVDRFTGSTDYQGFFFQPDFHGPHHGPVALSRVNIAGEPTSRYLLWFAPGAAATLEDVWLDVPAEREGGLGRAVWPDDAGREVSARVDRGERLAASWTSSTITGRVYGGRPPDGDFVRPEDVGIGYRSPGYQTAEDERARAFGR